MYTQILCTPCGRANCLLVGVESRTARVPTQLPFGQLYLAILSADLQKRRDDMGNKFSNRERRRVIAEFEKSHGVKLTRKIGHKYLAGDDGNCFVVLGATGDWHGIPGEVFDQVATDPDRHTLLLARKMRERMIVYRGSLRPFVDRIELLTRTEKGAIHFDTERIGDSLRVLQLPGVRLERLFEVTSSTAQREFEEKLFRALGQTVNADQEQEIIRRLIDEPAYRQLG